ncbi:mitotic spindle assembly checkpoint protein MAD2 [Fistulifera solaris]|uniref:Mitotic spindle assembly checkpoint protein MAD2 n=1 Tax=Fistulifera solaris TaxID=1519565 RepID=A0A1Z5KBC4_FISSO|nr:mitotic spindle assembly checkpoint protein MAD2 [Fistulifera solaris]|eukprot:GAX23590.1 mitotic spindle assembly checkpoint protein MAD2 [Fistulifera solaris]
MPTATANKTEITLKGSVDIVSDFFFTAINSILYQRGIYMPETFSKESKYGLTVMTTTDEGLLNYLQNVQKQVAEWLMNGLVQRLVLVVQGVDSTETLERWQFNVSVEGESGENIVPNVSKKGSKSIKEVHDEIQAIIRQITASVTFLPLLQEPCTFDLLVYTDKEVIAPEKWADSDPCYILNSTEVKLRSFTTSVHKIDSMVSYKEADEWDI